MTDPPLTEKRVVFVRFSQVPSTPCTPLRPPGTVTVTFEYGAKLPTGWNTRSRPEATHDPGVGGASFGVLPAAGGAENRMVI